MRWRFAKWAAAKAKERAVPHLTALAAVARRRKFMQI